MNSKKIFFIFYIILSLPILFSKQKSIDSVILISLLLLSFFHLYLSFSENMRDFKFRFLIQYLLQFSIYFMIMTFEAKHELNYLLIYFIFQQRNCIRKDQVGKIAYYFINLMASLAMICIIFEIKLGLSGLDFERSKENLFNSMIQLQFLLALYFVERNKAEKSENVNIDLSDKVTTSSQENQSVDRIRNLALEKMNVLKTAIDEKVRCLVDNCIKIKNSVQDIKNEIEFSMEISRRQQDSLSNNRILADGFNELTFQVKDLVQFIQQEGTELMVLSAENSADLDSSLNEVIHLQKSLKSISKALLSIKEISSKTNLLSLNASIEAARAGDSGLGFSVVADEIGKLAKNSEIKVIEMNNIQNQLTENIQRNLVFSNSSIESNQIVLEKFTNIHDQIHHLNLEISLQSSKYSDILTNIHVFSDLSLEMNKAMEEKLRKSENIVSQTDSFLNQTYELIEVSMVLNDCIDALKGTIQENPYNSAQYTSI